MAQFILKSTGEELLELDWRTRPPAVNAENSCNHTQPDGKTAWRIDIGAMFGDELHCLLCRKTETDY